MDARRAADLLGIPFYVWDFSERFRDDVIDDFISEYQAGRTPNPCMRCNEKIKFAALLERAIELGFDAVCTGHYATLVDGTGGLELHRASDNAKDQLYVLGVLTAEQLAHTYFPLGETPSKARARRGCRARPERRAEARQPRHLLHPGRRYPRLAGREGRRRLWRRRRSQRRGHRVARGGARLHCGAASWSEARCPRIRRQAAIRARGAPGIEHGRGRPQGGAGHRRDLGSGTPGQALRPRSRRSTARCRSVRIRSRYPLMPFFGCRSAGRPGRRPGRRGARSDRRALRRHARAWPVHDRQDRLRRPRARVGQRPAAGR